MFEWAVVPRVIGHRGSPREAPENTLASFRAAWAAGARAFELDVRLTKDDALVVHHDAQLGRIVGGAGFIEALPRAQLPAAVPTLAEVLRALPDALVDVEVKADALNAEDVPRRVREVVEDARATERVLVTSFAPELADAYAAASGRPAGYILPFPPDAGDLDAWPRLSFVALAADAVVEEALALAKERGSRLLAWTVNDIEDARALLAAGVEGIITDRPGAMRALSAPG